ncbi:MAG: polyphosphate kinase 1 [Chloroherpetonaceae bacterium]
MKNLKDNKYFINREISLIDFNERVLYEAMDERHPLLERLKFCTIFSSNIDEFFMIRVAGLKGQIESNVIELSYDGKAPKEQLSDIHRKLIPLFELHSKILMEDIFPKLKENKIEFHLYNELNTEDKLFLNDYFDKYCFPVLTPLSLGPTNPFPHLINRSLNIAFILNDNTSKEEIFSFLLTPNFLPRLIRLPKQDGYHFVLLEEIIKANAYKIYPGMQIMGAYNFRVTRDADIEIAEDEAEDLLSEISEQIKLRRWGMAPVRLEVNPHFPNDLLDFLNQYLNLTDDDVYVYDRPLNLPDFMELTRLELPTLKDAPFSPRILQDFQGDNEAIFTAISQNDYLVHHPFDSFSNSVLRFLNIASTDPDVLLIKITLYRTDHQSPILEALKLAAENGKSVTAFVELKARFDEENNIVWAKKLEKSGVHVVYGVPHLKTHCKIAYVVRREQDIFRTYVHLSTGNYNQVTSRLYTDVGFFTSNPDFAKDAALLFNFLTSYAHPADWKNFAVAPINLYQKLVYLIDREIEKSTPENPGLIFAKMNQLAHREIIPKLYEASMAGVKIQLLVRGVCCLRPGMPEISENIEVRSILGRFLEHSRIFYFKNGGEEEFYLSSADWMSRNLHNRVEVMFPIYHKNLRNTLWNTLNTYWKDNTKSWRLNPDGTYTKLTPQEGEKSFIAQEFFLEQIKNHRNKSKKQ